MVEQHQRDPQRTELLRVCRIGRAQGLKGEVTVQVFTDEPERRFAVGNPLVAEDGRTFIVERSRTFKQRWILRFEGISDRTGAESLRNVVLCTPPDPTQDMKTEEAWYPKDLIGLEVRMADGNDLGVEDGMLVGHVSDVLAGSAQSLLEVTLTGDPAKEGESALIPFVRQLVPDVDVDRHLVTINPPPGLIPGLPTSQ